MADTTRDTKRRKTSHNQPTTTPTMKCWIATVSKDHTMRGVAGGFMQACHGKQGPLQRMSKGDWIVFYSPKQTFEGKTPLQAFTAIGRTNADEVYQVQQFEGFHPWRRNVSFESCIEVPIAPLFERLSFIKNKKSWGYPFRVGLFEIPLQDFELIKCKMLKDKETTTNKDKDEDEDESEESKENEKVVN